MTLKISISGIRGIVGESFTEEIALEISKAFGTFLNNGKVAVAGDTRPSSKLFKHLILSGLASTGCLPVDLGICPTPTVGIAVKELGCSGGIVITASHNPVEWNGLKFFRGDGTFIKEDELNKLINIWKTKKFKETAETKSIEKGEALTIHIEKILKVLDVKSIKERQFKVALDSCNGAGGKITQMFLKELGCKVLAINVEENEPFPHPPEPIPQNIKDLTELVKREKADIGFAQDPDADRLSIVSEKGEAAGEEYTLALSADYILSKPLNQKTIVTNLSTSMIIDDIAGNHNARLIRTKIGEINVAQEILKSAAAIGGEGNGGVIYPEVSLSRDSITAIGLILEYLAKSKKKTSVLIDSLPKYYMYKEKININSAEEAEEALNKIKEKYISEKMDLTDGVKIIFKDSWIHVRPSNTEPILRVITEAKSKEEAKLLCNLILEVLNQVP